MNTYKSSTSAEDGCIPCPPNTGTVTEGSTSQDQCICDAGYKLSDDGTCEGRIYCTVIPTVHAHGNVFFL